MIAFLALVVPVLPTVLALSAVNAVAGYLTQFLKARKSFPTAAAQAIAFSIGVGLFAASHHPTFSDGDWWTSAVAWGGMAVGSASVAASTGLAPKTDSKP